MELDFAAVRALSSPTRLRILAAVLEQDRTPTELAGELDKSKSTVVTHLTTLADAGLVEKDAEDGRRRVLYSATRTAEAIVEGKERRVKFSVVSSALATALGITVLFRAAQRQGTQVAAQAGAATADAGGAATAHTASPLLMNDALVSGVGLAALLIAALASLYALALNQLPSAARR